MEFKIGDRVSIVDSQYAGHPSRTAGGTGTVCRVSEVLVWLCIENCPPEQATSDGRPWVFSKEQVRKIEDAALFPHDSKERKTYPMYSGPLSYFPAALAAVAKHSYENNERHNPGEDMHWSRHKSTDHLDALVRHVMEGDLVGAAWRALAALQLECEERGAPMAPAAR